MGLFIFEDTATHLMPEAASPAIVLIIYTTLFGGGFAVKEKKPL